MLQRRALRRCGGWALRLPLRGPRQQREPVKCIYNIYVFICMYMVICLSIYIYIYAKTHRRIYIEHALLHATHLRVGQSRPTWLRDALAIAQLGRPVSSVRLWLARALQRRRQPETATAQGGADLKGMVDSRMDWDGTQGSPGNSN